MDDLTVVFADFFKEILNESKKHEERKITPDNVYQIGKSERLYVFKKVCKSLLISGSGIWGFENLLELYNLCKEGHSCLILSEHVSNFDVPNLYTLTSDIENGKYEQLFKDIIFIAGRKLNEESDYVNVLTESFSRVVINPKTSIYPILEGETEEEKLNESMRINRRAQKVIKELKTQGFIFLLYPTGTRYRPWDEKTSVGLRETYNYINNFEYFVFCGISGNTLPPMEKEMIREVPVKDKVVFNFSKVFKSSEYIEQIEKEFVNGSHSSDNLDKKQFVVADVMKEIKKLGNIK